MLKIFTQSQADNVKRFNLIKHIGKLPDKNKPKVNIFNIQLDRFYRIRK